jgi:hypothetical protein
MQTFDNALVKIAEITEAFQNNDADYLPVALMRTKNDDFVAMDLSDLLDDKDALTDLILPTIIGSAGVVEITLVLSSWVVKADLKDGETRADVIKRMQILPPSEHPDRVEALVVLGFSRDEEICQIAEINRSSEGPPTLGEFEVISEDDPRGAMTGRFADPLRKAISMVIA